MGLGDIFGRREDFDDEPRNEEQYMEVNVSGPSHESTGQGQTIQGKFGLKIENLDDYADTERVLRHIRDGSIVFLKIKGLKEKDMGELKRAVEKLKKSVLANSGDIVGAEENWLILTPEFVNVHR
jgi:SepF-like predicted cell division protein (DUF552 family)